MSPNVLQVRAAVTGQASVSNLLCERLVSSLSSEGAEIRTRDLDTAPVPHVTSRSLVGVLRTAPATPEEELTRQLSQELIDEVNWADILAIAAPMYNFGVPSQLKAWFDHLMRAGATFEYVDGVPRGLLTDKRAFICSARGNRYRGTDMADLDCQEPHLRAMLAWMGITDCTFITAEGLALGYESRDKAISEALAEIAALEQRPQTR